MASSKNWRLYERITASLQVEEYSSMDTSVQANAAIIGRSGTKRQIDVLIDARFDKGFRRRIIVDAKSYKRKLNIKDVDEFHGMMIDCSASRGVLVCRNGWSKAAERRASDYIGLSLINEEELDSHSFYFSANYCYACPEGIAFLDNHVVEKFEKLYYIVFTGKCDRCRSFYIWCQGCGEHFSVRDGDSTSCSCGYLWYVVPPDPNGNEDVDDLEPHSAYLLLAHGSTDSEEQKVLCLDRRRGA